MRNDRRIWRMGDPIQLEFASVEAEEASTSGKPCRVCRIPAWHRNGTIDAYWSRERGLPTKFGSFTWGAERPLVVRALAKSLSERFSGVRTRRVNFPGKRTRIPGDSSIVDLDTRVTVKALEQSTMKKGGPCTGCGSQRFDLTGVEDDTYKWRGSRWFKVVVPRLPKHGLLVHAATVERVGYFAWDDRPFCTSEFKAVVEDFGATNVRFSEWGETVRSRE